MIGIQIIWVALPPTGTADEPNPNDWEYSRNYRLRRHRRADNITQVSRKIRKIEEAASGVVRAGCRSLRADACHVRAKTSG
jgi:hypothetical protein